MAVTTFGVDSTVIESVAGLYVMTQDTTNRVQLNIDGTFSLIQKGRNYRGTFTIENKKLSIQQTGHRPRTAGTIQDETIIDTEGSTWVRQSVKEK